MRFPGSTLWRTFIVVMATLVLSVMAATVLFEYQVARPTTDRRVSNFVNHVRTIRAALETMSGSVETEFVRRIAASEGVRVIHAGREPAPENLVVAPESDRYRGFRQRFKDAFGPQTEIYVRQEDETPSRSYMWVRVTVPPQDDYWIGIPRRQIEPITPLGALLWGATAVAIAAFAAFVIIRWINEPLAALSRAADDIDVVHRARQLPEDGPDEVRAVGRAFNRMMDRLRRIESERANFLAGVSHDLRTPLQHLQLEVALAQGRLGDETKRDMLHDLDDMEAILGNFIDFARTETGEPLSPVDLSELARECSGRLDPPARVKLELSDLPPVNLRPLAIQRLMKNLLSNAVRHGGADLEVRTAVHDGDLVFSVLDRGPGIPQDQVEHMKQPFTRMNEARGGIPGSGLGLAIADRIAHLHGGQLNLLPRDGGGLEARLTLPLGTAANGPCA